MATLYVEPFSGLAGDMFLGALASLCDAYDDLVSLPKRLGMDDARVEILESNKNGIACHQVKVIDLSRTVDGGSGNPIHRHLCDILELIQAADLPQGAKERAKAIFQLIGDAESEVHGIPVDRIHFHEISAVDSIVDVVGSAWMLDRLEVDRCFCEPVCTGFGTVRMSHGEMPLPAPATALLLRGIPVYKGGESGERTTPTGAAVLKSLDPEFDVPPFRVEKLGYGPGERAFSIPNVVRLSLVSPLSSEHPVEVIESDLDDCPGEALGTFFQDGLFSVGALDFAIVPTIMKKGRPGMRLSVMVPREKRDLVSDFILENTSTIGLRVYPVLRRTLARKDVSVSTPFGMVKGKEVRTPSGGKRFKPDHSEWVRLRTGGSGVGLGRTADESDGA